MGARAYAHGRDIYFAEGEYQPTSPEGSELIGHELAHTAQQGTATERPSEPRHKLEIGPVGDSLEIEADAYGKSFRDAALGGPVQTLPRALSVSSAGRISRAPNPEGSVDERRAPSGESNKGTLEIHAKSSGEANSDSQTAPADLQPTAGVLFSEEELKGALAEISAVFTMEAAAADYNRSAYADARPQDRDSRPPWWADGAYEVIELNVGIDTALTSSRNVGRAFSVRIAEAAAAHFDAKFQTRMGLGQLVDAATAAGYWSRQHLVAGKTSAPSDVQLRDAIDEQLAAGKHSIRMRVKGFQSVLTWFYEEYLPKRARMMREFSTKQSGQAELILLDFLTAHVNGVVGVLNSALSLASAVGGGATSRFVAPP